MYFLDKNGDAVENCPTCNSIFIVDKGAECPDACLAKKLEKEHEKATRKMVKYCLPHNKELKIIFPPGRLLLEEDEEGKTKWGLTYDFKQLIEIPWYTLRNKKEFFNTIAHEIAHITAYEEKFNLSERKVIYYFKSLLLEYNDLEHVDYNGLHSKLISELRSYQTKYEGIIDEYWGWESRGHDYNFWYQEYLKFFDKLVDSPYVKYAYGDTKPRSYGFDKDGGGKYDPNER